MKAQVSTSRRASPVPPGYARRLHTEHAALDHCLEDIIVRARSGDWRDCDCVWDAFSSDLERHMRFEEQQLFGLYEVSSSEAAQVVARLRTEHAVIRAQLDLLGLEIQLHLIRAETIENLAAMLRAHAEEEDRSFYPWLEAHLRHGR